MHAAAVVWAPPVERYRVLSRLGERPSGIAYLAEDRSSGRRVALHVACWSARDQGPRAARLREAAELVSRVEHAHLLAVLDFFVAEDGRPCVVTEHVEGGSLADLVAARGGWLPPHEALAIACEVLEGLTALHDAGMVHGALVPQSVRICPGDDGRPTVKLADVATSSGLPDPRRLQDGGAAWMRADVFAVASMLQSMVAGARRLRPEPGQASPLDGPAMAVLDSVLAQALGARRGFESAAEMRHALRDIDRASLLGAPGSPAPAGSDLAQSGVRLVLPARSALPPPRCDPSLEITQSRRLVHGRRGQERAVVVAVLIAGLMMSVLLGWVLLHALR